jgi:hypothetical protein
LRQFRFYIQKSLRGRIYRLYSHTIHTRSINPTKKQQLTIREIRNQTKSKSRVNKRKQEKKKEGLERVIALTYGAS